MLVISCFVPRDKECILSPLEHDRCWWKEGITGLNAAAPSSQACHHQPILLAFAQVVPIFLEHPPHHTYPSTKGKPVLPLSSHLEVACPSSALKGLVCTPLCLH